MLIHCTRVALLLMATALGVASCDGEAPSGYPLRAHGLTAEWCPDASEFRWTLDFGIGADTDRNNVGGKLGVTYGW